MKRERDDKKDPEVSKVIREEKSRGRRPIDEEAKEEARKLKAGMIQLIRNNDEGGFIEALNALGLYSGDPLFEERMKKWHDYQSQKRKNP